MASAVSFQHDAPSLSIDPISSFMALSRDLLGLIQTENSGSVSEMETHISRKVSLLQDFEKQAQNLLNFISIGLSSSKTRLTVTGEVEKVREALRANSVLNVKRLKAKIAGIGPHAEISEGMPEGMKVTCH